jgi:hypothetical protein
MPKKIVYSNPFGKKVKNFLQKIHANVLMLNGSKVFAGCMIMVLNISSRFVTIKLSKSMESYLKYTFSRQILIFAIAWMGTRDIYIALAVATMFTIIMDFLLNEDNMFCVLPSSFTDYHVQLSDDDDNDITRNIPGMPNIPTKKNDNKDKDSDKNVIVNNNDDTISKNEIDNALSVIKKAKHQNTLSFKDEFYNNNYE